MARHRLNGLSWKKRCFCFRNVRYRFNRFLRATELEFSSTSAGARTVDIIRGHFLLDSLSEIGEVFGSFKANNIDEPVSLAGIDDLSKPFF
jgi:hypothetical protein